MSGADDDAFFDRAREAVDVRAWADRLKLFAASRRRWRGVCPFGACGKKSKSRPFWLDEGLRRFGCFSCGESGDVIALEHQLAGSAGETRRQTAARILGLNPADHAPLRDRAQPRAAGPRRADDYAPVQGVTGEGLKAEGRRPSARKAQASARDGRSERYIREVAQGLWGGARPAAGTPVEWYLRARGLAGPVLTAMLGQLRFHPAAQHAEIRDRTFPAMIGLIVAPDGGRAIPTGGVHATYLAEGGDLSWGKAQVGRAKTIWGPPKLGAAWGGVWLTSPRAEGPLHVGEGIESTGSAMVLAGVACRGVAALSLNALQGRWLEDRWGRVDPSIPRLDPAAPGFTWPEDPAAPWGEVRVCIDRDMSPIHRRVRRPMGGTVRELIAGEARSRVCAALAEASWRQALVAGRDANGGRASATIVKTWAPGPGRDFSDELAARTAGEGVTQ